jgi:hypothetical protein
MSEYNGWPNKVTWQVSLYCTSLEDVQYAREWLEEIASELPLIAMDLLTSAIAEVDWYRLEEVFSPESNNDDTD